MKVAVAVALIFIARFAVAAWFDPGRDGDIAWQQWLGLQILHTGQIPLALGPETFTAAGAPWVPQEWLLSIVVALTVGTSRFALLVALTTVAGAATLLLTAWSAKRLGASSVPTAICTFFVAFSMVESYGIRAQVFAWTMLAALLLVLRTFEGRARWWSVPIIVLWANLHASALLGPALLGLWTLGVAIEARGLNGRVREYATLTLACAGAVFLTPLSYRLPLYAIALFRSPIRANINEWQPGNILEPSFALGAFALIVLTCALGVPRYRRWAEFLMFGAVSWMAFAALRNAPVCAIVLAPAVARRLTEYMPERLRINAIFSERPAVALLYCGTFIAAVFAGAALAGSDDFRGEHLPLRAIASLASISGTHKLYCEDFAWCSSALPYANLQEFMDGRCDPFPLSVWKDYETIYGAKPQWRSVLNRRAVDAIIIDKKSRLAGALPSWRNWRLVYADNTYRLFIRDRRGTAYQQQ